MFLAFLVNMSERFYYRHTCCSLYNAQYRTVLVMTKGRLSLKKKCELIDVARIPTEMASQPIASAGISSFSFDSFVRGYHAYMDRWDPWIGEVLPL